MNPHPNIYPVLRYQEPDKALEWLKSAFGFAEHTVYRDDSGTVQHAELHLGVGMIMMSGGREDSWLGGKAADPLASPVSVYIAVDDPDAHHKRAKAAGAEIVHELSDMDYGSREYSARDPEGNLWSFGTYHPVR